MEWKIDYLEEDNIVLVKTTGIAGWDDSRKLSEQAAECGRSKGSGRFLIDNRNLERTLDTLQVDMLPGMLKQVGITAEDRLALLYESSSPLKKTHQFFKDVSYLASIQVRLFTEIDEAVA
jgi:hypothetical protein